jgi:hypothetical protein
MTAWEAMLARLLDADGPDDDLVDPIDPETDGVLAPFVERDEDIDDNESGDLSPEDERLSEGLNR